jgi:NADH:ubiquinone oxidoreductase subunit 6 (subunit J)
VLLLLLLVLLLVLLLLLLLVLVLVLVLVLQHAMQPPNPVQNHSRPTEQIFFEVQYFLPVAIVFVVLVRVNLVEFLSFCASSRPDLASHTIRSYLSPTIHASED